VGGDHCHDYVCTSWSEIGHLVGFTVSNHHRRYIPCITRITWWRACLPLTDDTSDPLYSARITVSHSQFSLNWDPGTAGPSSTVEMCIAYGVVGTPRSVRHHRYQRNDVMLAQKRTFIYQANMVGNYRVDIVIQATLQTREYPNMGCLPRNT
jgi:hypothetical protein